MLDSVQLKTARYAGIVGLQNGYLDSLFLEITLGLSKVQRSVVRRRMPETSQPDVLRWLNSSRKSPIGQEGNLVGRHDFGEQAAKVNTSHILLPPGEKGK